MAYDGTRPLTATDIRESLRNPPPMKNSITDYLAEAMIEYLVREGHLSAQEAAEVMAGEVAPPAEQGETP